MKTIIALAMCALLTNCGMAYNAKIKNEVLNSPETSYSTKELIKARKITVGMTQKEVIASWGSPCGHCYGTRKSSAGEWWEYNVFGSGRYSAGAGTYLFFDNTGKLKYWSE